MGWLIRGWGGTLEDGVAHLRTGWLIRGRGGSLEDRVAH